MKNYLFFALLFLFGLDAFAQVPQRFNYQAVARNKDGEPLANQKVSLEIIIKQGTNSVFTEKQEATTNDFGLFTLEIGSKSPLNTVNWSQGALTMDVKIDPSGGSSFDLLGTIQLLAVPYALYAANANEQQRLQLNNNQLSITKADGTTAVNTITLPTSTGGNADNWGTQTVLTTPVLSGKGTSVDPLSIAPQGAVNGQFLKWNGTTWVPGNVTVSGDNWGTQTVETSPVLKGKGTSADPLSIASQGAVSGQVLQWNGTTWVPGTINISGGDGWGNQVAKTNTATISGDGSATNPLNLANNAVTSDKIVDGGVQGVDINQMNAADGQVLKWLNNSWQPANDNTSGTSGATIYSGINGINVNNTTNVISLNPLTFNATTNELSITGGNKITLPTGGGGSDNWGTQTVSTNTTISGNGTSGNPLSIADGGVTTAKLANNAVDASKLAQMSASDGQVLKWSQSQNRWIPQADNTGGTGGAGDNWGTQTAITNASISGNGTAGNPLSVAPQNALSGQVLKWNGTAWAPANDETSTGGTTYTGGTGISITGNTISNTGDTNASDDITTSTAASGDVNGTFSTTSVIGLRGRLIATNTPTNGQVLTYNGTQWIPQTPTTGGSYLAGVGISISGNIISNTGINTSTNAGGDLNGFFPNPSVIGLRNIPISATQPNTIGQVLTYDGSQWIPQTPTTGGSSSWTEYTQGSQQGIVSNREVVKIGNLTSLTLRPDGINLAECPPNIFCLLDGWTSIKSGNIDIEAPSNATLPVARLGGRVVAGSLEVGNITSTGNISATGTANITGNTTIGGNATVTRDLSAGNVTATGNVTVGGNATVAGDLDVKSRVYVGAGQQGNGNVITYNSSRTKLVSMEGSTPSGYGVVTVWGTNGTTARARMYLDPNNGQGVIQADVKNFKVPHPIKKDKDIWYASLEGPEAAMYERGTATLKNGEAFIPYSETFELMLSPKTATVNLTPQYWDTFGLAVIEKTDKGFRVKELKGGTGNFKFDWEVKGVRKGYENYQVIRDKEDNQSEKSEPSIKDEPLKEGLPEKAKVDATIKN